MSVTLDQIMEVCQPHLQKISNVFGSKMILTLLVQAPNKPGCLILANQTAAIEDLIKALKETEALESVDNSNLKN